LASTDHQYGQLRFVTASTNSNTKQPALSVYLVNSAASLRVLLGVGVKHENQPVLQFCQPTIENIKSIHLQTL